MIKLDTIKVLISKALIDLHVSHDECNLVNNVIREYNDYERKTEKSWRYWGIYYMKTTETYSVSCKKNTAKKNSSVRRTGQKRLMTVSDCAIFDK